MFVVLSGYLLFTSGAVFEIFKVDSIAIPEMPYSVALSDYRINLSGHFTQKDIEQRAWLEKQPYNVIYSDFYGNLFLSETMYLRELKMLQSGDLSKVPPRCYIFLTSENEDKGTVWVWRGAGCRTEEKIKR